MYEIAEREDISLKYLDQIIRPLTRAGYIKFFRGTLPAKSTPKSLKGVRL
jgi:DNA-binding IscR family transcriptional regulator